MHGKVLGMLCLFSSLLSLENSHFTLLKGHSYFERATWMLKYLPYCKYYWENEQRWCHQKVFNGDQTGQNSMLNKNDQWKEKENSLGFNVLKDWKSCLFWRQAYGEGALMPKLLLVMCGLGSSEISKLTFGILPASKWKWCLHIE